MILKDMMNLTPISLAEANQFVADHHRHHKPVVGHKFCLAVEKDEEVVGVAIVGRPVARGLDDGYTLEVNRCCTTGAKNACSMLYGASWRAAKALGYRRLITYVLDSETGTSLKASNWKLVHEVRGRSWDTPSRPRVDTHPLQNKMMFEAT
tara:strand:+ start:1828 stop:2280 length:453 start_codon:yes stop_codon:yes gene_type:complete